MSTQTPQSGYVTVEIYDQTYHLSGKDLERTRRLAARVDERMRAVAAASRTADSLRVAVLAALNLADQLARAEDKLDEQEQLEHPSQPEAARGGNTFAEWAESRAEKQAEARELDRIKARAASLTELLEAVLVEEPPPGR